MFYVEEFILILQKKKGLRLSMFYSSSLVSSASVSGASKAANTAA